MGYYLAYFLLIQLVHGTDTDDSSFLSIIIELPIHFLHSPCILPLPVCLLALILVPPIRQVVPGNQ